MLLNCTSLQQPQLRNSLESLQMSSLGTRYAASGARFRFCTMMATSEE